MGSGLSGLASENNGPSLGDVPESCVSSILMYLDPPEICKLAGLNRTFHGASSADLVWETKLPSNYKFLVNQVLQESLVSLAKKQIYARLCQPNCFDGGTKQVWLDKNSGKICLSISYKALRITGIDDRRYWNHISSEESRFQTIAYLQQIWWFEVVGEIEFEFPADTYNLLFRLQLGKTSNKRFGRRVCNTDQVHGWNIKPVQFQLSTSNGQRDSSEYYLHEQGNWVYYNVGEFTVENPNTPIQLKFSMTQIDCTHTKGGVCLDSVLICPVIVSGLGKQMCLKLLPEMSSVVHPALMITGKNPLSTLWNQKIEFGHQASYCIAHVQAVGRPLSNAFDVEMLDHTGKCTLKYWSQREHCLSSGGETGTSYRLRSLAGTLGWESMSLNTTLLGNGAVDEKLLDDL